MLDPQRKLGLSTLCVLPLAVMIPWQVMGTLSLGRALCIVSAGVVLLLALARLVAWLPWWIALVFLPGAYVVLVGWIDLRVVFPTVLLLVSLFACALGGLSSKGGKLAAVLVYVVAGCGVVLGYLPVAASSVILAAPLVFRVAWVEKLPLSERVLPYVMTVSLLCVAYLIHGIVR
ncbi:MAG: hypothetical protein JW892_05175 [Anaerolineae bacterium]|nr:hypothetical protein [Anaerolineae bacterium]